MTAQQFVLEIGRAMHVLGSPSYRVEDTMAACGKALGLEGSFFSTPTAIFAALGVPGSELKTSLLRVMPGGQDLGRLAELYAIRDEVVRKNATPTVGLERVREVMARAERARPSELVALALGGAGAGVLFGGGPLEAAFAGGAGALVGVLGVAARRWPGLGDVHAPLSCALVAFLVHTAAALGLPLDPRITSVAALVQLLPGLAFTNALAELAMQHLASGSARLLGAIAVLLTMVVGVGIGDRAAALLCGEPMAHTAVAMGIGWYVAALGAVWLAYCVLLRATRDQAVWVLAGVALGYCGARMGQATLGPEFGTFVGALLVTFAGNVFARWRRRPATVVRTPGLLLLVPGSVGYKGFAIVAAGDPSARSEGAILLLQMLIVGGSIVAGMLMAGVLLPPPIDVEPDARRQPGVQ